MDERVKELLDRVRGTAVTMGEVAGSTARFAGKCAGQMVDVAKLNMKIFDLKADVNGLLRDVGQMVYDTHRGADADAGAVDALLRQIDERHAAIAELKERGAVLKNARECPGCGAACGREDKFCRDCGQAL